MDGRDNNTRNNKLAMDLVREQLFRKGCWVCKAPPERKHLDSVDLWVKGPGNSDCKLEVSVGCSDRQTETYRCGPKGTPKKVPVGSMIYVFVNLSNPVKPLFWMAQSSEVWDGRDVRDFDFPVNRSHRDRWDLLGA